MVRFHVVSTVAELQDRLRHIGWVDVDIVNDGDMLALAADLGRPGPSRPRGPLLDRLVPLSPTDAHPRSMSAVFGKGPFPFHTDLAHSSFPPRFVLLRAEQADDSGRQTVLHDLQRLPLTPTDRQLLAHGPFFVRGGRRPFLSSILDQVPRLMTTFLRYDPCCMTPASPSGHDAVLLLKEKTSAVDPVRIEWLPGRTVVLDNWRVLHARTAPRLTRRRNTRILQRILVWPVGTPVH